jgi:hypothetical protein
MQAPFWPHQNRFLENAGAISHVFSSACVRSEAHKVDAPDDGFSIDYRSESEDALKAFSEQGCTALHKAVIDSCSGA